MSVLGLPKIANFDQLFEESETSQVIPLDLFGNKEQAELMMQQLFGDVKEYAFSYAASCNCGELNSNAFEGMLCHKCLTTCTSSYCEQIEFRGWFVLPEIFPKLLVPTAYWIFKHWLKKVGKTSVLEMLLNPRVETAFPELGQGLSNFYARFDEIIEYFQSLKKYHDPSITLFVSMYRDQLFVNKIPVINNGLHVITTAAQGSDSKRTDSVSPLLLELKTDLDGLCFDYYTRCKPANATQIDKQMFNIQQTWVTYIEQLWNTKLFGKPGLIRKSMVSGRMHFTFRGVCVPITDVDYGDELKMPWKAFVVEFKTMIINKLVARGYRQKEALSIHTYAIHNHVELIEDIAYELIEECPFKGLPCIIQRNPSLRQGAGALVFITGITMNDTLAVSQLYIAAMNMDFDGDQGNGFSIREMKLIPDMHTLHPAMTMFSRAKSGMSGYVKLSDPDAVMANRWLTEDA